MGVEASEFQISEKGAPVKVPGLVIDSRTVIVAGRWLRVARVRGEDWLPGELVPDPAVVVSKLKEARLGADLFVFAQAIADTTPKFPQYHMEWDNVAVIPLTTYDEWWKGLSQESRRNVRLAQKRGARVEVAPFDDDLVRGIKEIYDETPWRQRRRFWHYGKDLETVKRDNSSYADRSDFLGAYRELELIGFLKMVYVGQHASIMQILSKNKYFDLRPPSALIAKAVEVSCQKGLKHLLYCKYVYGRKVHSSLTEFKRRLGFQALLYPRYYIPLTAKGALAIKLGLHHEIMDRLPEGLSEALLNLRARYYMFLSRRRDRRRPSPAGESSGDDSVRSS
jgi:hypothetical protein